MASKRQSDANRLNAKKSTGPKSTTGKARSCKNALRHGLSITSNALPIFQKDVMQLAQALSQAQENIVDEALNAASAELDLLRIRKCRAALIEQSCDEGGPSAVDLANKLRILERYECRAFTRRNKAVQACAKN